MITLAIKPPHFWLSSYGVQRTTHIKCGSYDMNYQGQGLRHGAIRTKLQLRYGSGGKGLTVRVQMSLANGRYGLWSFIMMHKLMCWDFFKPWRNSLSGARPPHFRGFMTTLGRTPLDEWSARRRDLYPITQNIHKRQTFLSPAGFETTIPASERPLASACAGFRYCQALLTASL